MAVIEKGYGNEPTHIKVNSRGDGSAEIWLVQDAFKDKKEGETLSYASLTEILKLRDELNIVIKELVGL